MSSRIDASSRALELNMAKATKLVLKALAIYGTLWLLTARWGNHDIDCDFDRQFSVGNRGSPLGGATVPTPIVRIDELPDSRNLENPANKEAIPQYPWRYRSGAIAVAPFIVI